MQTSVDMDANGSEKGGSQHAIHESCKWYSHPSANAALAKQWWPRYRSSPLTWRLRSAASGMRTSSASQGPRSHSRWLARSSRSDGGGQDARRYGSAHGIQQSRA